MEKISFANWRILKVIFESIGENYINIYLFEVNPSNIKIIIDSLYIPDNKKKLHKYFSNNVVSRFRNKLENYLFLIN